MGPVHRVINECPRLLQAGIRHCLCISQARLAEAALVGTSRQQALRIVVFCEVKHPMVFTVLPLPAALCGDREAVDVLVALILPK